MAQSLLLEELYTFDYYYSAIWFELTLNWINPSR